MFLTGISRCHLFGKHRNTRQTRETRCFQLKGRLLVRKFVKIAPCGFFSFKYIPIVDGTPHMPLFNGKM
jgi:hypothetical protein